MHPGVRSAPRGELAPEGGPLGLQEASRLTWEFCSESEIQLCVTFLRVNVSCVDFSGMVLV